MRTEGADHSERLSQDLKAVLFDVDGTFYRLRELQRAVQRHFVRGNWQRPLEAWRVHRAVTAYRHAIDVLRATQPVGADLSEAPLEHASKSAKLSKEFVRGCIGRWMMEEPLAFLLRFRHDGVLEALQHMTEAGLHLGIFSGFPAATKLRALGIENSFEAVISAQDPEVRRFKPDPRGLQLVLERMGIPARQALYVGDRPEIDGLAAERAGMAFFAVGDGHPDPVQSFQRLREIVLGPKAR